MFALRAANDAYDLGLLDNALDLAKQISVEQGKMKLELPMAAKQMLTFSNGDIVTYAAWDDEGNTISGNASLSRLEVPTVQENHIFEAINLEGEKYRAIVLRTGVYGKNLYVAVAQTIHGRQHLTRNIFFNLLLPEALLAFVAISIVLFGVRRGLAPVKSLSVEIHSRTPQDLRPIDESDAPAELRPIVHGVNVLLEKLALSFASHRRFIADASHQLRTPLAVLSSQIEVNIAQPPADVKAMLEQLLATTHRTSHLANQLLSLARLEHTEQHVYEHPVELNEVVRLAAADFVTRAEGKNVDLEFDLLPCKVFGDALLLRELVANLLDNAIRYTPAGGRVSVRLWPESLSCHLSIEDDGPGLPEAELASLGKPFYRPLIDQQGCGLGLAIVWEITRLHKAEIQFTNRQPHGLCATVKMTMADTSIKA